jgi:glycerol-1-phosphate dehydrogenase [NAD(P)+]
MGALERAQVLIEKADPSKTLPLCEIKEIEIGREALFKIVEITEKFISLNSKVALVVDKTTILRQQLDVKKLVRELLASKFVVVNVELDDGYTELHASEDVISESTKQSKGVDGIITIGGGTITDIGKMTSVALGGIPHIAIQTAASVDGYTDNVSVILMKGVKRTVPSRWPEAVIADTTLISEAPSLMNRAGYGEINSMFTAPADWRLAALLGFEKKFHWGPIELLHGVGEGIEEWAPGLRTSEVESIKKLVNALAVRGIVTGVADTTACLSGIEHLISHMLDMNQAATHKPVGQHGAQVGVGSVIAAAVWDLIFIKLSGNPIQLTSFPDKAALKSRVITTFHNLDTSDALGGECWKDYEKKIDFWIENSQSIQSFLNDWSSHSTELRGLIKTPEEIVQGLLVSGSPINFDDLEPEISELDAFWAVSNCHLMRNRFVGIDLLEFLGMWAESDINWVFERATQVVEKVSSAK